MNKSDHIEMSAEVTLTDLASELKEVAETISDSILYLNYTDPNREEYRQVFRSLLESSRDLSETALNLFDSLCIVKNNKES